MFGGAANLTALDIADGTADGVIQLANLDGANGFILNGIDTCDLSGRSVSSAGDVNGDGFDDLIIGAILADPNGLSSGESYVVFGGAANLTALDNADGTADGVIQLANLNGTTGFILNGIDTGDFSGRSVSAAGDVNGDGFDDLIVGALSAEPNGISSGEIYVVFGGTANLEALDGNADGVIELADLTIATGFSLNGIDTINRTGFSVSAAGDVNGDGFDDLIIGADGADPNGPDSGESYVVFGGAAYLTALDNAEGTADGVIQLANLNSATGFILNGIVAIDASGV